ncbi:hypothetical protein BASA81_005343 [Batrachochytrium salamandrivorans]|nr:hypothetical protein BASA81_005343 [Batrachochytrium salamandrivorans]
MNPDPQLPPSLSPSLVDVENNPFPSVSASPDVSKPAPSSSSLPTSSTSIQAIPFWSTAFVVTVVFLMHGWLAEMLVISVVNNGYSLGWFFALLTVLGQWLPTLPRSGWKRTDGFRMEHMVVGFAHCFSLGMSNSGGMLVEYNTYSLFKSSKVVFVMLVSWLLLGVHASPQELFWGLGLMAGLLMLTGADEKYAPESHRVTAPILGATFLTCGIGGSALVSVSQQASLQRRVWQKNAKGFFTWQLPNQPNPFSKDDEREALLFWSNLVSIALLGAVCLANGELISGMRFFREVATIKIWLAQIAAMALVSFGQRLVLNLNGHYGATASSAVLTFRKVASFVTSVLVFPKPFHPLHALGLFVIVTCAVMIQRAEANAAHNRKAKTLSSKSTETV